MFPGSIQDLWQQPFPYVSPFMCHAYRRFKCSPDDSGHTSVPRSFSESCFRIQQNSGLRYKMFVSRVAVLIPSFLFALWRRAKIATTKKIIHAGDECHGVRKAFVHFKCFADCKVPHDELGRALSLQFCSVMIFARITL